MKREITKVRRSSYGRCTVTVDAETGEEISRTPVLYSYTISYTIGKVKRGRTIINRSEEEAIAYMEKQFERIDSEKK